MNGNYTYACDAGISVGSSNIYQTMNSAYSAYSALASGGIYQTKEIKKNNMKETNLKNFTIVFEKTEVKKFIYKLLAENEEDAKKKIEDGGYRNDEETVSIVVKEVK